MENGIKKKSQNERELVVRNNLSKQIQVRLEEIDKTQLWLSKQTGLTAPYITYLIQGSRNPTIKTIVRIEEALGVELIEVK